MLMQIFVTYSEYCQRVHVVLDTERLCSVLNRHHLHSFGIVHFCFLHILLYYNNKVVVDVHSTSPLDIICSMSSEGFGGKNQKPPNFRHTTSCLWQHHISPKVKGSSTSVLSPQRDTETVNPLKHDFQ